jgi:glutaconyl-CoA/methylmalonyl-CoA decarboxylase subunit gamma
MKYRVRIDETWYEVEIVDLNDRPVKAIVEGEIFEVWPEENLSGAGSRPAAPAEARKVQARPLPAGLKGTAPSSRMPVAPTGLNEGSLKILRAPIPGVVVSISIQPEEEVSVGQELCVLEAMKMKNSIRASRSGKIEAIKISVGQHVKHHDVLFEYAE